jgi:hypothetical protein
VAVLSIIIFATLALSSCYGTSISNMNDLRFKQAVIPAKSVNVLYQSLMHEGDLIVSGNEKLTIENCEYQLIGNIIVKDDATLTIKDVIFNQTTNQYLPGSITSDIDANIVVGNRSSLFLINTTLMIPQNVTSRILVQNEGKMYATDSKIENFEHDVSIWAIDSSLLYIQNSIMRRAKENVGYRTAEMAVIVCTDYSEVHIENVTFDRTTVYQRSKVFIQRSTLKDALRIFDSPTVQVTGSIIYGYVTAEGNPILYVRSSIIGYGNSTTNPSISASESTTSADIWLIHVNLDEVIAGGSSKVRLIDSSVKNLYLYDNAELFVGWDLPIFGPVAFTPQVAFAIQLIALNLLAVTIIIVVFVVLRKLRKRRLNEPKLLSSAVKC